MNDEITQVNPDDIVENFWGHNYNVTLSRHGPTLLVNASYEGDALDFAIDYAESQSWEGLFLDQDDIQELESDGFLDDYVSGGNHGRYLSSLNVRIVEV